jgi:Icc-related predicted phosphoesterase
VKISFFATDLHGRVDRYERLFAAIVDARPAAVFLGGDLLPTALEAIASTTVLDDGFVKGFLGVRLGELRARLGTAYPRLFVILGNDDGRFEEADVVDLEAQGIWVYAHNRKSVIDDHTIYGYAYVPPTPFQLKDWERYDVSRYVPPGCLSPEEGSHSTLIPEDELRYSTIQRDIDTLAGDDSMEQAVFLFHAPPHETALDRAALDDKWIDHVPLDVHVGSIALRRFIEKRQPLLTLHGHIHESARLTGAWKDRIGRTHMFSAAHDGPELALIRFDLDNPEDAVRLLL